jgi:mono/diheme cytochrome c family protein
VLWRQPGRIRQRIGLAVSTGSVVLQAGHSHAVSMYSGASFLLASDIVHLLAAGAWLGGLVPLLLAVLAMPAQVAASAARWFSPLGQICIVALLLSATFQGWVMVSSLAGLVGTGYGWMAIAKLLLFAVLFGFAAVNRYVLAPALLTCKAAVAKRRLVKSIAVQTGFSVAIVAAAVLLSSLAPAMHEQPNWPFADRFSLVTIGEDPDLRNEVVGAVLALFCAVLLAVLAVLVKQRVRWLAVIVAVVLGGSAVPHLELLLVPATPTSFYRSPTGFAATTIAAGAVLFAAHCAACHGKQGRGDGTAADLTAPHLWMHSDGELFWWLSHGIEGPSGHLAMPGFAAALSADDRWDLIDFIRANNAGLTFQATGAWSPPLRAPDLQARCDGGRVVSLADLRGGFVRVVFATVPPTLDRAVTTILATPEPTAKAGPGLCIADDETLPQAYAVIAGVPASEIGKAEFLIDGEGWLRAERHDGAWMDPVALSAAIRQLAAQPIAASAEDAHPRMQM